MKTLILCLSLLSLPAFAAGGNDGPSAVPQPPSQPGILAERVMHCGFFCPNRDTSKTIIYQDGRVMSIIEKSGSPQVVEETARLSPAATARFARAVAGIKDSQLVDEQAGTPKCQDAPTTIYNVYKSSGTAIEIGREMACHRYSLANGGGSDIIVTLDGLANVAP